jgi:hypothetical protein
VARNASEAWLSWSERRQWGSFEWLMQDLKV